LGMEPRQIPKVGRNLYLGEIPPLGLKKFRFVLFFSTVPVVFSGLGEVAFSQFYIGVVNAPCSLCVQTHWFLIQCRCTAALFLCNL